MFFIGLAIGLFVGWATPQPAWAKTLLASITAKINELRNKDEKNEF